MNQKLLIQGLGSFFSKVEKIYENSSNPNEKFSTSFWAINNTSYSHIACIGKNLMFQTCDNYF